MTSHLIENANEIAAQIEAMPEIESVNVWTKVAGKERIYVDVIRTTQDGTRYGGSGGRCFVDLNTGRVLKDSNGYNGSIYLNTYTKDFHTERKTTDLIRAIIAAA